jgi:putative copper resistance protein D
MIEAGLIASRFTHYLAALVLFGASIFPYVIYGQGFRQPAWLGRKLRAVFLVAACFALASGVAWLSFTAATMTGSPDSVADPSAIRAVLTETTFGHIWIARLALAALIIIVVLVRPSTLAAATAILSGVLLAGLAWTGHTQQDEGTHWLFHSTADTVHLLSAGAWLGGLLVLSFVLRSPDSEAESTEAALRRFSGMGYAAVALLVASGLVNSWYLVGSFAALTGTAYGRLLLVKLCLFAGMLALAASNRFWLVPALAKQHYFGPTATLARLRRHALAEEFLGILVIAIVSALGAMDPAAGP